MNPYTGNFDQPQNSMQPQAPQMAPGQNSMAYQQALAQALQAPQQSGGGASGGIADAINMMNRFKQIQGMKPPAAATPAVPPVPAAPAAPPVPSMDMGNPWMGA